MEQFDPDELDIAVIKELLADSYVSSSDIAKKYRKPLSTIQRRRHKIEQANFLRRNYCFRLDKISGLRTGTLLIEVRNGKSREIAKQLLTDLHDNITSTSTRIGDPKVDVIAEVAYKDTEQLHSLIQQIKASPSVTNVEWAEVVEIVGKNDLSLVKTIFDMVRGGFTYRKNNNHDRIENFLT